jgi:hypothetical protein
VLIVLDNRLHEIESVAASLTFKLIGGHGNDSCGQWRQSRATSAYIQQNLGRGNQKIPDLQFCDEDFTGITA